MAELDLDFLSLILRHEPRLRRAFRQAVDDLSGNASISRVVEALERGDVQGAVEALRIEPQAYRSLELAIEQAFEDGGGEAAQAISRLKDPQGNNLLIRFDVRNPRAEAELRNHSSRLIAEIVEDQRQAARDALVTGMQHGDNPRITALDFVGRIDRVQGRRTGGSIGLTAAQTRFVENAREELSSNDPMVLRRYLSRKLRDKRFDASVRTAVEQERPLGKRQIARIIRRYNDKLLKFRGDAIARTETLSALQRAKHEALSQLVDSGKVKANQIRRIWDATGDLRTRQDHMMADGQSVGFSEDFIVGGRQMKYPGDPRGAADQVINCRCDTKIRIDFLANL